MQDITEAVEDLNRIYTVWLFDQNSPDLISELRIDELAALLVIAHSKINSV